MGNSTSRAKAEDAKEVSEPAIEPSNDVPATDITYPALDSVHEPVVNSAPTNSKPPHPGPMELDDEDEIRVTTPAKKQAKPPRAEPLDSADEIHAKQALPQGSSAGIKKKSKRHDGLEQRRERRARKEKARAEAASKATASITAKPQEEVGDVIVVLSQRRKKRDARKKEKAAAAKAKAKKP